MGAGVQGGVRGQRAENRFTAAAASAHSPIIADSGRMTAANGSIAATRKRCRVSRLRSQTRVHRTARPPKTAAGFSAAIVFDQIRLCGMSA